MAMFEWKPGVTADQVSAFEADLATMPTVISGIQDYRFGRDLGLREGNFDFGVVAQLAGPGDVARYLDHPAHQELVSTHVVGMVATRRAVQISLA